MATKKTSSAAESYNGLRQHLDNVLLKLQDPACDVDEAVGLYEQALELIGRLERHLEEAENRIAKVKVDFGLDAATV